VLGPDEPRPRVLVIEDDPAYARVLRLSLEASRYQVAHARTGVDGLAQLAQLSPSLVLLDLTLPDIDGYQVCEQIRDQSDVPVIIVTARREEQDVLQGLLTGADDYITKPFSVDELLARVSTVLRRARVREGPGHPSTLRLGDLLIDFAGHRVTQIDQEVVLTALEFNLLTALARNAGRVILYGELLRSVWGTGHKGDVSVLRTTVRQLRGKLGDCEEQYIRNMRRVGYIFVKSS
jgi:DNA-binding response OmpR family regulator